MNREGLKQHYRNKRSEIEGRLEEFEDLKDSNDYRLFMELVFVILSSQTEARNAWKATKELDEENLLIEGSRDQIAEVLARHDIQYEENKADYIVENRKYLSQPTLSDPTNELKIWNKLDLDNKNKTREWLADNIKGLGWKGASHFLRNIGYGKDLAIISGHILNSMEELGVLEKTEQPSNKEEYIEIEEKIREFSDEIGIDIEALDLALWSRKTGEVFK